MGKYRIANGYICFLLFFLFNHFQGLAQKNIQEVFAVKSFKVLDMDLTARTVRPVVDQNDKKTALIKVVTSKDGFDFDVGMMGVTEVHQEIGEIWVYVPEKVQRITIRHAKYGVIRDYLFEMPIEGATVYELRLIIPDQESEVIKAPDLKMEQPTSRLEIRMMDDPVNRLETTPREKGSFLALLEMGFMETLSYGIRVGYFRKAGAYLSLKSNFESVATSYECTSDGLVEGGGAIWTTGKEKRKRLHVTAGAINRLNDRFSVYYGAGYGESVLAWEDAHGSWAKVGDFSYKGVAVEAGALCLIRNFVVSAGVSTINFKSFEISAGLGVRF